MPRGSIVSVIAVGASVLLAISNSLWASFSYVTETRSIVAAQHGQFSSSQGFSAPNFNDFSATARADELTMGVGAPTGAFSQQSQTSQLMADMIKTMGGWGGVRPSFVGTGTATGETITDVTFNIVSTTDVQLDATISVNDFNLLPQGARTVSLTGPNTNISWLIANFVGPPNPWTGSRSAVATLQPGQYRFFVDLYSFSGGFQPMTASVPSYNVTLTALPEPAAAGLIVLALGGTMRRRR